MFLYEIGIRLLVLSIRAATFLNSKAQLWVKGRRNWRENYRVSLQQIIDNQSLATKTLWVHAASLGEFEQGRPVVEAWKKRCPGWRVVLTFFSPSGYEVRKNYPQADFVAYLPADTKRNAADFLDIIRPDAAIFVKYEFWANYLFELKKRHIPVVLASALFRENQPFFRWYGAFWRKMLGCFGHFFVQNQESAGLLQRIGFQNITVAGDTRVDRVLKIAESAPDNDIAGDFTGGKPKPFNTASNLVFIAGSSWNADEAVFLSVFQRPDFQQYKLIIAPHEPSKENVGRLCRQLKNALRYSEYRKASSQDRRCLVIDNVGTLNTLYRYGTVAFIGGGFGRGIHNTLEPAAFGLPLIFGPKYEKFEEARQFVARGGAFPVRNTAELAAALKKLENPAFYAAASQAVRNYLEENRGATEKVVGFLKTMVRQ